MNTIPKRLFSMDLLRVLACFFVIHQHCAECFYGSTGHVEVGDDTFFVGFNTALGRICVPLFAMISGYFLLPINGGVGEFFKKRVARIVLPFIVWNVVYAVFFIFYAGDTPLQAVQNFFGMFLQFGEKCGHLWYVYMVLGLYLLAPVISPWLERASKRQLQFYGAIWLLTTLLPYLHRYVGAELWGECFWNVSPTFYYFTGFVGYFILGYYIRRFGSINGWIALLCVVVGWLPSVFFFTHDMYVYTEYADLEMSWNFCSINVVMMTFGVFTLFTKIKWQGNGWLGKLFSDVAAKSYGMYLGHMVVLLLVHTLLVSLYPTLFDVVVGDGYTYHRVFGNIPAVLIAVPVHAIITIVLIYVVIKILSYLPAAKRWLGV